MESQTRRGFLADVGKGMLVASVGVPLAAELGIAPARAEAEHEGDTHALTFGRLEPLVALLQENSAEKMLPLVVSRLSQGTSLRELVSAAALANARTFGGEDYIGYHAFMALLPAYQMTAELPAARRALPVLKVLYRSTSQIQAKGGRSAEVLHPVVPAALDGRTNLRDAMRRQELDKAETLFAGLVAQSPNAAFNALQTLVQDEADVHRVVLAYRAWDLLGLTGKEHAHTTLRQSVHYCVSAEKQRVAQGRPEPAIRSILPNVLDTHKLVGRSLGTRTADDAWVRAFCNTLLASTPAQAADAVGGALAEGFGLSAIGEALSLAATQQVLRDPGRTQAFPGKPIGSVHGDSYGVHASDSMNAWRNIAAVSSHENAVAGLIVAGYHLQAPTGRDWKSLPAYPFAESKAEITTTDPAALLRELDGAIRENHQAHAAAIVAHYSALGHAAAPVFALLLNYAVSEDGTLHAEKYYRTIVEEFGRTRKAHRGDHLVALARVTASEFGKRADGYEQACGLLRI